MNPGQPQSQPPTLQIIKVSNGYLVTSTEDGKATVAKETDELIELISKWADK